MLQSSSGKEVRSNVAIYSTFAPMYNVLAVLYDSSIMAAAITTIQMQTNSINHWVLHTLLIVIVKLELFFSDSQTLPC